jgi:hypothetical protein
MQILKGSIQESIEFKREEEWRKIGVPEPDIVCSRVTGMDARDIRTFREFSKRALLFVIRCPKNAARALHGVFPPKVVAVKEKTGSSALVVSKTGRIFVSDYDLMSVWRQSGAGWQKIFISAANGLPRGRWSHEATLLVRELNHSLVSRLQHGCQDDFQSRQNPGVKSLDHFAAFVRGAVRPLPTTQACGEFYTQHRLTWVYDAGGNYCGPFGIGD